MDNFAKKTSSAASSAVPQLDNYKLRNLSSKLGFTKGLKFRTQVPQFRIQVPHLKIIELLQSHINIDFIQVPHLLKIWLKKIQVPHSLNLEPIWFQGTFLSSVVVTPHITYGGKEPP